MTCSAGQARPAAIYVAPPAIVAETVRAGHRPGHSIIE